MSSNTLLIVYLGLLGLSLILFALTAYYNRLTYLNNRIGKRGWKIETLLHKKTELVPKLVFALAAYQNFDHTILTQLQIQKNDLENTQSINERNFYLGLLESSLRHVFILVENHSRARTDQAILQIQHQLLTLDRELSQNIKTYNQQVREYNKRIKFWPGRFLAWLFGYRQQEPRVWLTSGSS
jgi:LemA protein